VVLAAAPPTHAWRQTSWYQEHLSDLDRGASQPVHLHEDLDAGVKLNCETKEGVAFLYDMESEWLGGR